MSSTRYYVAAVECDAPDCFESEDDAGVAVAVVRANAVKSGWRCDRSGDWCPKHRFWKEDHA